MIVQFSSVAILAATFFSRRNIFAWDIYDATIAWLIATPILLAGNFVVESELRKWWQRWFFVWSFLGSIIWLIGAYLQNTRLAFYAADLLCVSLLILCKRWLRLRTFGIQAANTLILILIVVPIVSFIRSPSDEPDVPPRLEDKPYSYEAARKDPAVRARWLRYLNAQTPGFFRAIFVNGGDGMEGLRSNVTTTFVQSRISINSKGFRGKEISDDKGNAYRIVALGESTTFGITMAADEKPWPEILEQMIRERLKLSRPVEVINAGTPILSLKNNLARLPRQILPLKPDMIISYHGHNGLQFIYNGLPPIQGKQAPNYVERSIKLLADLEYNFKVAEYRKRYALNSVPQPAYVSSPMETEYARLYRELINVAQTNNIRLVLATYSMAVNDQSKSEVLDFYRMIAPGLEWKIKALAIHNGIIEQLARENPDICFVDTRPVLDGHDEFFYDFMHLTAEGKQRMAEIFFDGIKNVLEAEIGTTNSVK
jgi:lysophospholipase L1-like esterase